MEKEKKIQLLVYISESVDKGLRELINEKYKEFERGLLSEEVELALRNWIAAHTNANINHANPMPKVYRVYQQVKELLKEQGITYQTPLKKIVEAVSAIRGNDKRTIKKWLKEFGRQGLIKEIAPQIFELK